MRMPGNAIDRRFHEQRRRSTTAAGTVAAVLSLVLFEYHLLVERVFNWDLLVIGLTFAIIKLVSMLYHTRQR